MGSADEQVTQLGGTIAAVAVTATFSQMAFAAQVGVSFPLLSDWDGEVAEAYGVRYDVWKGHSGVAKRSVFVIDRGGVIRHRWVTEDALQLPPLGEAVEVVRGLV